MKIDAITLNFMHHFFLFMAFVYWTLTQNTWNAFGIMALSIFIGYFTTD
ncbi:MAG: hypothetical protein PHN56_06180 [Candidatus Nanoarchaeia archaeon]|nr:hypothetical protein [Candidatus Nanoarchaeia archaeon]